MNEIKDYGCDPMGDGTFKMVPSGKIVTKTEKEKLLPRKEAPKNECLGLTWLQIERMQGGKLKRP